MKYLKPGLLCFALIWAGFAAAAPANAVPVGPDFETERSAATSAKLVADRCVSMSCFADGMIAPGSRFYLMSESAGGFAPLSPFRQDNPFFSQAVGVFYGFTSESGGAETGAPLAAWHMDVRGLVRPDEFKLPGNRVLADVITARPRAEYLPVQRDVKAHALESSFAAASVNMLYGLNAMASLREPPGSLWQDGRNRKTFETPIGQAYRAFSASFPYLYPVNQALPFFSNSITVQFDRLDRSENATTEPSPDDGGCGSGRACPADVVRWGWERNEPGVNAVSRSRTISSGFVARVSFNYSAPFFAGSLEASYGRAEMFWTPLHQALPVSGTDTGEPEKQYACACDGGQDGNNNTGNNLQIGDGPPVDLGTGLSLGSLTKPELSPVPVPAALPLLASGIAGLGAFNLLRRRRPRA
ncbi:VPLPA-CTERM sorting domain-containing protein [Aestuariivirga sp.]|uniref:VPLPA-CTERM sorting domain-containing protein n=1 Tax=Aestuariivirga sp. TaxID=2650926 RepID=UPI0039E3A1F9